MSGKNDEREREKNRTKHEVESRDDCVRNKCKKYNGTTIGGVSNRKTNGLHYALCTVHRCMHVHERVCERSNKIYAVCGLFG